MMFLSRLSLDIRSATARRSLSDVNFLHQQVLAAYPSGVSPASPRADLGVLFRLDRTRDGRLFLLVQSTHKPDWARFPSDALLQADAFAGDGPNPSVKEVGPLFDAIQTGAEMRFRLRANVTKKIDTKTGADGKKRNGRRVPLTSEADRLAWLKRKGEQHGFQVGSVEIAGHDTPDLLDVSEGRVLGYRPTAPEGSGTLTFASTLFDGTMRVTDATLFRAVLRSGIGSAKAFGFGLLSIAPG